MKAAQLSIRSSRFRAKREADWKALETLVTQAERKGQRSLSFEEAVQLARLYRQTISALATAREISLDKALLEYLEALSARAYLAVYAPQESLGGMFTRFFRQTAPQAKRPRTPEWCPVPWPIGSPELICQRRFYRRSGEGWVRA